MSGTTVRWRAAALRILDTLTALRESARDPQLTVAVRFLLESTVDANLSARLRILRQHYLVSARLISPHTTEEILTFVRGVLNLPPDQPGYIVEAGSYKGASSAKFSVAAQVVGRRLVICDSFKGLPNSSEEHGTSIENRPVFFHEGDFAGSLEEVKANIARYGALEVCEFVEGWYDESLPSWSRAIAALYVDVDLAASTRAVLKYLYPWIGPGCSLYSQDGHLPLVLAVFEDRAFWNDELGIDPPVVQGIWQRKLIRITKSHISA